MSANNKQPLPLIADALRVFDAHDALGAPGAPDVQAPALAVPTCDGKTVFQKLNADFQSAAALAPAKGAMRALARANARLFAVQALYMMEIGGAGLTECLGEFDGYWRTHRGENADETALYGAPEAAFFEKIMTGVLKNQVTIDRKVDAALAEGWPLKRIEAVLRALLRAGAFEMMFGRDVPARVVMSEYVDIAGAFVEDEECGLVNGVLNTIARAYRKKEFEPRA